MSSETEGLTTVNFGFVGRRGTRLAKGDCCRIDSGNGVEAWRRRHCLEVWMITSDSEYNGKAAARIFHHAVGGTVLVQREHCVLHGKAQGSDSIHSIICPVTLVRPIDSDN
jgi:hypothetical protein